jgi:hypothetical protein
MNLSGQTGRPSGRQIELLTRGRSKTAAGRGGRKAGINSRIPKNCRSRRLSATRNTEVGGQRSEIGGRIPRTPLLPAAVAIF